MKNWNIDAIEALTEPEARALALETATVKGHAVYFIDFPGGFGYSACVFFDGRQITHANDYALHHHGEMQEELHRLYMDRLALILFTEEELTRPLADADDYERRSNFLRNYYPQRRDYVSLFFSGSEEDRQKLLRRIESGMIFNPIAYAYFDDKEFVRRHLRLYSALEKLNAAKKDDFDYWRGAFLAQMYNIEYGINWEADYDCLSHFGNIEYVGNENDLQNYFAQLSFTETQRSAYIEARREYYHRERDNL